jgi:phosphoglycerate dehydrogenase-like enzyme
VSQPSINVVAWLPEGMLAELVRRHPGFTWHDARSPEAFDRYFPSATITYGLPPVSRLEEAEALRWVQLVTAGVPWELCVAAREHDLTVTNLAGLYGSSIAEHTFALLTVLARNLHLAFRNQEKGVWDRGIARGQIDLCGRTLALIGLGDLGRACARLGRAYGMRVIGCRRRDLPNAEVDRLYSLQELPAMLSEADFVVVAAPLTPHTEGLLGPNEFEAMKPGVIFVNVSRGGIVSEDALLEGLRSGRVASAGLEVFATEPLPPGHPLWALPQVVVIPHVAGEVVNQSTRPAERFSRNLAAWQAGRELEGVVDLEWGY